MRFEILIKSCATILFSFLGDLIKDFKRQVLQPARPFVQNSAKEDMNLNSLILLPNYEMSKLMVSQINFNIKEDTKKIFSTHYNNTRVENKYIKKKKTQEFMGNKPLYRTLV